LFITLAVITHNSIAIRHPVTIISCGAFVPLALKWPLHTQHVSLISVKALIISNIIQSVCLVGKGWLKEKCGLELRTDFFRLRNRHKLVRIRFENIRYNIYIYIHTYIVGDRGSTVVNVLCYISEGRWFDPSWCQWICPGSKGGRYVRLASYHHPEPLSWNLGILTSWNPVGVSRSVTGLLYLFIYVVHRKCGFCLTVWRRNYFFNFSTPCK